MMKQSTKRNIAIAVLLLNMPLYGLFKNLGIDLPEQWEFLPFLINLLIAAIAFYFVYRYSSRHKKISLLLIPVVVLLLAFLTFLWERL